MLRTVNGLRILTISDVQGNFDILTKLYYEYQPIDIIIHTGNFGFWDTNTIQEYKEINYFKQIVAFSEVLETELTEQLNNLSKISSSTTNTNGTFDELAKFKANLLSSTNSISQFEQYVSGVKKFPCPVYTVFGPLDDPKIIDKLQTKQIVIPNLYLVDHKNNYEIPTEPHLPNIKLYGLGGTLKIHSLFDNGNLNYLGVCGKLGELWISLLQIAELYINVTNSKSIQLDQNKNSTINIFISHVPVVKAPLLEHLAIITHADFTISQGLHFRYPVMGNGMSFVDSMGGSAGYVENYRSKFSRLRMILGELWVVLKDELVDLLLNSDSSESLKNLIELGLSLFDKIPVSVNDSSEKIVPLSLYPEENSDLNKKLLKRINDYYFQAYYNLWHFNLCDYNSESNGRHNVMIFKLDNSGNFNLDYCTSQGFNFNFKLTDDESDTDNNKNGSSNGEMEDELLTRPGSSSSSSSSQKPFRGSSRGRGNTRGRGSRGGSNNNGNSRGSFRGRRGGPKPPR
ncbi:SPBC16H5.12c Uncharacterized protein C16H5.12c [Candida maltosa Xu316]|uniref:DUF2433 domain-containing protein n=1 Tax=Candida maltosa (strain Xu316) TaxID=1245528 RepID=M3K204_CANMX|nr:hypothetical protein G210_5928 [Candida maltosa Xu316]